MIFKITFLGFNRNKTKRKKKEKEADRRSSVAGDLFRASNLWSHPTDPESHNVDLLSMAELH